LSLAGILSYYTNQKFTQLNFLDRINKLNNDFKQKRIFDIGLKIGLGTVFILLLVSFLFFSSYTSKIDGLNTSLEVNKTQKNSFLKLSDLVNKKEKLINDFSLTSSKAAWYINQIGETLPHSIILSEIQWQPLTKNIKKEKQVLVQKNSIIIKGKSGNNTKFSSWVNLLEKQSWIDTIQIQEYGTGKKSSTEFKLRIKIKK
jgi:Tfp pilus assembly protein PilN